MRSFSLFAVAAAMVAFSSLLVSSHPVAIKRTTAQGIIDTDFKFEVDLEGSVADLKDSVAKTYHVSPDLVRILLHDTQLVSGSLSDAKKSPDKLMILVDFGIIEVVGPDRRLSCVFGVRPGDQIAHIKDKITRISGVARDLQRLFLGGGVVELSDDAPVDTTHIKGNLTLLVGSVYARVRLPSGELFVFRFGPSDEVADLKKEIHAKKGFAPDRQSLFFDGRELANDETLFDARLTLKVRPAGQSVQQCHAQVRLPSGELVTFEFEQTEQVASLKEKIRGEKGVAPERQSLYLNGKELADDEPLVCSTLTLMVRPDEKSHRVHVRLASKRLITFEVDLFLETTASLKSKISQAEGIGQELQHLFVTPERELLDDRKLADYLLPISEPIVDLRVCPSDVKGVYIESLDKPPVGPFAQEMTIGHDDTVADMKAKLQQAKNIPHDRELHLFSAGQELADGKKVSEYVKEKGSPYLHLVTRKKAGISMIHVKLPSGRLMTFEIALSSRVGNLSAQLQSEKQEFHMDRQILSFNGQQLENDKSLKSYGIERGSTVKLSLKSLIDQ